MIKGVFPLTPWDQHQVTAHVGQTQSDPSRTRRTRARLLQSWRSRMHRYRRLTFLFSTFCHWHVCLHVKSQEQAEVDLCWLMFSWRQNVDINIVTLVTQRPTRLTVNIIVYNYMTETRQLRGLCLCLASTLQVVLFSSVTHVLSPSDHTPVPRVT